MARRLQPSDDGRYPVQPGSGLGMPEKLWLPVTVHTALPSLRSVVCFGVVIFAALTAGVGATPFPAKDTPLEKVGEFHLKYGRQGAAAAVLGEYIYIFGGSSGGAVVSTVERFNTRTAQVEPLGVRLLPRRYHSVLEHAGKFYLIGGEGYGLRGNPLEHAVEIYDPATDQVAPGVAMALPRSHMAAAKLGDKVYICGGSRLKGYNRAQTNDTEIFDFSTGKWSRGVPMPTSRESMAAMVGDFILVPGGFRGRVATPNVEMFVPQENVWKTLPPLPRAISAHSLVFFGEHLFLFGDYDELDSVVAYNLRTRQSSSLKIGFKGARHTTAVVCGDRIYVMGGNLSSEGDGLDLIQVFAANPAYAAK